MSLSWKLAEVLKTQGIKNASQLQKKLKAELGIEISRQSLHKLINKKPQEIRIDTIQAICNLLQISSHHLLLVTPEPKLEHTSGSQKLYKKKPKSHYLLSDPREFLK